MKKSHRVVRGPLARVQDEIISTYRYCVLGLKTFTYLVGLMVSQRHLRQERLHCANESTVFFGGSIADVGPSWEEKRHMQQKRNSGGFQGEVAGRLQTTAGIGAGVLGVEAGSYSTAVEIGKDVRGIDSPNRCIASELSGGNMRGAGLPVLITLRRRRL
ncbi:hypothetical protein J6590_096568 [Homalodisca vitripennis]|nr:hypothetical protein J6590_096568 [Homalodisca vitripennis]